MPDHIIADDSSGRSDKTPAHLAADALRDIADRIGSLDLPPVALTLHIQPTCWPRELSEAEQVAAVDAVAAVLGVQAKPHEMDSGAWHHQAHAEIGPMQVATYCPVVDPAAVTA